MGRIQKGVMRRVVGTDLIAPLWYFKTKWSLFLSKKIKVGFGPIVSGEETLAERKWRIDPIIDGINRLNGKYSAGFFLTFSEMIRFDLIVFVKKINPDWIAYLEMAKGKKVIYDIVDNPNDEPLYRYYFRSFPQFIERVDRFILSSPVHFPLMKKWGKEALLIEHPILNPTGERKERKWGGIRILVQGYFENLQNLGWLERLLPTLSKKAGQPILLYYHTEGVKPDSEFVRYVKWSVESCFSLMEEMDIAIGMKDLFKPHQYTKPATKIIAYMAAGLPVICKPTPAEQLVIQDQVTGFFAYREADWVEWLLRLATNQRLRDQVGKAARQAVSKSYSLNEILNKYLRVLDSLQ